jgi:hypothetical protein
MEEYAASVAVFNIENTGSKMGNDGQFDEKKSKSQMDTIGENETGSEEGRVGTVEVQEDDDFPLLLDKKSMQKMKSLKVSIQE